MEAANRKSGWIELNGAGGVTPLAYPKTRNERLFEYSGNSLAERLFLAENRRPD